MSKEGGSGGQGERVLVVFVESAEPRVERLVTQALGDVGFAVHRASGQNDSPVELDYRKARYAVVVLTGEAISSEGTLKWRRGTHQATLERMPALVFTGVQIPTGFPGAIYLALDDRGRWMRLLVEKLRLPRSAM